MADAGRSPSWLKVASAYGRPVTRRSVLQLATTAFCFVALWLAMERSVEVGYWAVLLLALPTAGFLVRLFMIQHDCGHGSFFRSRRMNDLVGRAIGVVTLTPYEYWRRSHARHHATSGDLDRRGMGDIDLLTVGEYRALPRWRRLLYRLYRHPVVFLGIGPSFLFVVKHRLPLDGLCRRRSVLVSVLTTNLSIAALTAAGMAAFGISHFLAVQIPITVIASSIGVWLFYVQHQFERTYWRRSEEWSFEASALEGSSHYDLPRLLRWFTADIGIHHVHHLCSRIPNYRLRECLADHPELQEVSRLTLRDSLRCFRLALWDEETGRLVGFRGSGAGARAA